MGMSTRTLRPGGFPRRVLYFFANPALSPAQQATWSELANWYLDDGAVKQATALPRSVDSVFVYGNIDATGGATGYVPVVRKIYAQNNIGIDLRVRTVADFLGGISGVITAGIKINVYGSNDGTLRAPTVHFHWSAINYSQVEAMETVFFDESLNAGNVLGYTDFYNNAYNYGNVSGDAGFYNESVNDGGTILGTATFNDNSNNYGYADVVVCNTTGVCP